ncbi:cytochrome P450 716B1-like isoform X2 [Asparagus officinalis]|uniref:cytochrome P450 716B1-like isoform X2 n=1 Tax=Asparagus officinalis TaxID=4686 RepID=UPI00098E0C5C|nr:cytochrome P450 716B1-like isoform X2 [Asparagus officinalis]
MTPLILLLLSLLPLLYLLTKLRTTREKLPPGSLGIPYIGDSLGLLRAMRANRAEDWLAQRIQKYGPISKLTLFGAPTVFVTGPAANKLVFSNEALVPRQPKSIPRLIGRRNMLELSGDDHKRVRGAVGEFLRPELLKKYVGGIEEEIKLHLENDWIDQKKIKVLPLMKRLAFDITCSLLFGIKHGPLREELAKDFAKMIKGMWAVPVNLPYTNFNRSLKASNTVRKVLARIVQERKAAVGQGKSSSKEDLITYLIGMELSDEEVVDNAVLVMIAGHDTSALLLTFIIRHLANDPTTRARVVQEEVANSKAPGETLTWDDLSRMKYTWRVAMEVLRTIPPVFGSFRKTLKDVEFNGYIIPKGWQVFWAASITQMDPKFFPEPEKFDPNRFENVKSIPPYCFLAFGGGSRICPGNDFARIETMVMMHHLVTKFEWKLCCEVDTFSRDPMPSPREGLPIELWRKYKNCSKDKSM